MRSLYNSEPLEKRVKIIPIEAGIELNRSGLFLWRFAEGKKPKNKNRIDRKLLRRFPTKIGVILNFLIWFTSYTKVSL